MVGVNKSEKVVAENRNVYLLRHIQLASLMHPMPSCCYIANNSLSDSCCQMA